MMITTLALLMTTAAPPAVDQSDPVKVLEAVFTAARADAPPSWLSGLCDPKGDGDGDTKRICRVKAGEKGWKELKAWFSTGKVTGSATVRGDRAAVPFTFGPKGDRKETMKLVRRAGKWYLYSF